jgi:type IV pilus assembly protein PilB
MRIEKKLGEILVERKLISAEQIARAIKEQAGSGEFLGKILLKRHLIKDADLLSALSEQFAIPVVSLKDRYIDWGLVKDFSASLILDHRCFPVERDESSVTFGITNPLDAWAVDKAKDETQGLRLKLVLVSNADMDEAIQRYKQYLRGNILRGFK